MSLVRLLNEIKNEPRTSVKVKLLREYSNQDELERFLVYAYSNREIFGLTSTGLRVPWVYGLNEDIPFDLFEKIKVTPGRNDKTKLLRDGLTLRKKEVIDYILKAIDKDLNIGINRKLINTAFNKEVIPDFGCMLAFKQDEKRFNNEFGKLEWCYYNVKVDGIRAVVTVQSSDIIEFKSRDGKELQPFLVENIKSEIARNIVHFIGLELDCEISSTHFQKLMRIVNRKNVDMSSIYIRNTTKLSIFDIKSLGHLPLIERVAFMETLEKKIDSSKIKFLKYFKVKMDYNLIASIARKYIVAGAEGIIIKNPHSLYQTKRSNSWLKFKDKNTIDLKIIGYYPGEPGTEFEHCLGGIILKYKNTELRCGSGFSEKERVEFWTIKEELLDKITEISYMEETKTGSLRHPVFERFRFDKETTDD
jgi:DNA ligase-1